MLKYILTHFLFIMKRRRAKMKMTTLCRMVYIHKNIVPAYLQSVGI